MSKDLVVGYPPRFKWVLGTVAGSSTMTRPSDTTPYTAGDEISNSTVQATAAAWVFANASRINGGYPTVLRAIMVTNNNATISPTLWLYNTAPTMVGDNAPFSHIAADDNDNFGVSLGLSFVSTNAVGTDGIANYASNPTMPMVCTTASSSLYGVLVAGAYTPASAQTFTLRLLVQE